MRSAILLCCGPDAARNEAAPAQREEGAPTAHLVLLLADSIGLLAPYWASNT